MQSGSPSPGVIRFGVFELDARSGELRKRGLKTRLPPQSFQILCLLLERPGEVVTREELQQRLWPGDTVVDFDTGLSSAIRKLREALDDSAENPRFVETLPRRGYRFIAPVEAPTGRPPEDRRAERPGESAAAARGPIKSIAVLPLANLSGDPSQDYFADGMTDALITQLAQLTALRVISRTSVMRYRESTKPLAAIARDLNVDAVLEGAVARSGQRVRITAQLVHAPMDRHLWARSYQRDLGDVLTLQDEVARTIVEGIEVTLTPQERARLGHRRIVNPKAYDAYLMGRYHLNKETAADCLKARGHFEDAIAKESEYAPAHAGLSDCYRLLGLLGPPSPQESMPKAEAAARKALELDEALADAHVSLAAILYRFRWDWSESEREFRRALGLAPSHADGHREYSFFLAAAGRFEAALAEAERARELDPLSPNPALGWIFFWAGQYDRALVEFRRTRAMYPDVPRPHLGIGGTLTLQGDFREGIRELATAVKLSRRNPQWLARLGHAYAVAGQESKAREILAELHARSQEEQVSRVAIAIVHVGLGDKEGALAWLEKAYQLHEFDLVTPQPRFDPLRSEPCFKDLMRRVGLPG